MATANVQLVTTFVAGEDLSASGCGYHAIALDDGKLANNGEEASGILQSNLAKPENGQHGTICFNGESKFAAGADISKGAKLTVATSGWFTTAGSGQNVVGEAKAAVTSGSIGTGLFAFAAVRDPANFFRASYTPKGAVLAGVAIDFADGLPAAAGEAADAVAQAALSSGYPGEVSVGGLSTVLADPANCCSAGDALTVNGSGYFTPGDSGDYIKGTAFENIGSNSTGRAIVTPVGYYLAV